MKETTSTTTDIDSLAAAIIQLEIQNITLLKSNGNIEIKSLEERLQKLQEENKKLVHISSTSSGNVLDFSDGNVSTTTTTTAFFPIPTELDKDKPTTVDNSIKKGDSKSFNLLAPEKVKRNRSEDIAKSARRLKKLVAEMQQNIQPLAPSAKFDEIHINEYQYFLNPQSIRSVGGDGSRTKRIMTVGSTDTTELSSVPLEAENLEISGDTTDLTQLPPVVVLEGRVSESDYKDTGRSEASFSGHFDSMDINSSELPPSFIGTIHGSFEFCVIEADLRVLIPSDESRLRRSPTQVRSTAQSSQIQGYNMLVSHNGSNRILSSYFPSRATYNYPQTLSAPSIENISDFCFPSGVSVNICGVASANCFIDSSNDKFHVMQFTNSYGHITYACCLTIRKAMQLPTDSEIAKQILLLSVQQKAARIIMKILRYYAMISKRNKWQSYSQKVSRPKLSPAPPPSLSRPVSLTSPNSRTLSTSDAQSPENISFFSKYFRPSSLSTQKKTLVTDLTTMYNDIIMIMNDDGEDISLQKLVELSTTLKKARDAGCVADVFPVLAKCDSLLNSYGVGLEPNDKATHRKFLPTGSSGVSSTSTIASTVVASNNGHDSHTDARLSVSPTRTSAMTEGGEEENKTVGSSNTDNKLHVITDNIDPLSPDSEDSESSSESESSQHMAAFKDYYKSDSELTHKLPWEHMMDPTGKVMITHQAYCVVTSSPHHALFYQVRMLLDSVVFICMYDYDDFYIFLSPYRC